ncbi:hypothetical protein Tco_0723670 [Tanacetum coccineum]
MDSIIQIGQKNTLAEYMILSGVDNRPPILDKDLVTRTKKYAELSATKKNQADCDLKATSIILQGLAVPLFKQGDDLIDAINKIMSFLSTIVTSHFPSTNNQLRNSSNPRQQATIHDGRKDISKTMSKSQKERDHVVIEKSSYWSNSNGNGKSSNEEELDSRSNVLSEDTSSSTQQDALILSMFEQLSNQVTNYNKVNNDNLIANETLSAELKRYKEQEKEAQNIDTKIALEKKVKELDNVVCKMGQSAQMLTKPQVFYDNNLKQALGFQNPFYLKKAQQIRPMLYDGNVIAKETNVISIADSEENLMLEEESRSKMLLKQSDPISDEQALHPIINQSASSPVKIEAPRELPKLCLAAVTLTLAVLTPRSS